MRIQRIAISAVFAAGLSALPLAGADAQCPPFPLFWPFCVAGAVVGVTGAIVTAPFRALAPPPPPPYYYRPYGPYYYPPPAAYPPGYYGPPSRY